MEKSVFAGHLQEAVRVTLAFTRSFCWNSLPNEVDFIIQPDSLNENAPHLNELEINHFRKRKAEISRRFSAAEVVDRLWVNGYVPVWVNISVYKARRHHTTLELLLDRRLRQSATDIYHQREGFPPFHVQVALPPYLQEKQPPAKFNINWQRWPWRLRWKGWIAWNRLVSRIKHGPSPFLIK